MIGGDAPIAVEIGGRSAKGMLLGVSVERWLVDLSAPALSTRVEAGGSARKNQGTFVDVQLCLQQGEPHAYPATSLALRGPSFSRALSLVVRRSHEGLIASQTCLQSKTLITWKTNTAFFGKRCMEFDFTIGSHHRNSVELVGSTPDLRDH